MITTCTLADSTQPGHADHMTDPKRPEPQPTKPSDQPKFPPQPQRPVEDPKPDR